MSQVVDIQGIGPVEFPDGMKPEDIQKAIETSIIPQWQAQHPEMTASRAGGLTARALAEGAGVIADTPHLLAHGANLGGKAIADFLRGMVGLHPSMPVGDLSMPATGLADSAADSAGLPSPATHGERLYTGAVRAVPSSLVTGGGALIPALSGGAAAQEAAERGYGPVGQTVAGIAGGGAAAALRAPVSALANTVVNRVAPATAAATQRALGTGGYVAREAPTATPALQNTVLDAMHADQVTPAQLADQVAAARAAGKPAAVADFGGPNVQGLVRAAATVPGRGQAMIRQALDARSTPEASLPRMQGDASEMAQGVTPEKAAAAYEAAGANAPGGAPVRSPDLQALLESTPAFREAHESFGPAIARAGETPPSQLFADVLDAEGNKVGSQLMRHPTVHDVDVIKRVLDKQLEAAREPGGVSSADQAAANALKARQSELLAATDKVVPAYARARELGGLNVNLRDVNDKLSAAADKSKFPDLVKPVAGTSNVGQAADTLRAQFGTDRANAFMQRADMERRILALRNNTFGGSNTVNKGAELAASGVDPLEAAQAAVHPTGAIVSKVLGTISGKINAGRNAAIAANLASTSGDQADKFLRALDEAYKARVARGGH